MTSWSDLLAAEKQQDYFKQTLDFVRQRREQGVKIYPPADKVFNAFESTPFEQVKVVILGQDPYHGLGQAHGLCFSVQPGVKPPPSLKNIFKELKDDIEGFEIPAHGCLQSWAQQGVLLLNTVLTVEEGQAHSHKKLGWERFTDKVIEQLSLYSEGIIFLLWGAHAHKKGRIIDRKKHQVLTAVHPSPLSAHRGFLGCRHFSQSNRLLLAKGMTPIDWRLPSL